MIWEPLVSVLLSSPVAPRLLYYESPGELTENPRPRPHAVPGDTSIPAVWPGTALTLSDDGRKSRGLLEESICQRVRECPGSPCTASQSLSCAGRQSFFPACFKYTAVRHKQVALIAGCRHRWIAFCRHSSQERGAIASLKIALPTFAGTHAPGEGRGWVPQPQLGLPGATPVVFSRSPEPQLCPWLVLGDGGAPSPGASCPVCSHTRWGLWSWPLRWPCPARRWQVAVTCTVVGEQHLLVLAQRSDF